MMSNYLVYEASRQETWLVLDSSGERASGQARSTMIGTLPGSLCLSRIGEAKDDRHHPYRLRKEREHLDKEEEELT